MVLLLHEVLQQIYIHGLSPLLLLLQGLLVPPRIGSTVGSDHDLARTRAFLAREGLVFLTILAAVVEMVLAPIGFLVGDGGAASVGVGLRAVVGDVGVNGLGILLGEEAVF